MGKKNPLQLPYHLEFSPWQDWKWFLGGLFVLLLPVTAIVLTVAYFVLLS